MRELLKHRDHLGIHQRIVQEVQKKLHATIRIVEDAARLRVDAPQSLDFTRQRISHRTQRWCNVRTVTAGCVSNVSLLDARYWKADLGPGVAGAGAPKPPPAGVAVRGGGCVGAVGVRPRGMPGCGEGGGAGPRGM